MRNSQMQPQNWLEPLEISIFCLYLLSKIIVLGSQNGPLIKHFKMHYLNLESIHHTESVTVSNDVLSILTFNQCVGHSHGIPVDTRIDWVIETSFSQK